MTNSIDVCLAAYEGDCFIVEQVESILLQLPANAKILVSDDSPHSKLKDILDSLNDSRIKYFQGPKMGVVKNFEFLLSVSTADIIFLSDQDDVWLSSKLDRAINLLKEHDLVVCNGYIVDKDLNHSNLQLFDWRGSSTGFFHNLIKNGFVGCCMVFKKEVKEKLVPFPVGIAMHDQWIGLGATALGFSVFFERTPYILYRRHEGNVTQLNSKASIITRMKNRYLLMEKICLLILKERLRF